VRLSGHADLSWLNGPTAAEAPAAKRIGMLASVSEAKWMNTCTIGTASNNAGAAATMVSPDLLCAASQMLPFIPCRNKVSSEVRISQVPGKSGA
jgi:hypothetical protein